MLWRKYKSVMLRNYSSNEVRSSQSSISNNNIKQSRGFTLVELLVVIAIIGILAVMMVVSYTNAQKRSRDTTRKADLQNISSALAMRFAEEKNYPATDGYIETANLVGVSPKSIYDNLHTTYLSTIPCDPLLTSVTSDCEKGFSSTIHGYAYYYNPSLSKYALFANLEISSVSDSENRFNDLKSYTGATTETRWNYAIGN